MTNVVINGCLGRMGKMLSETIEADKRFNLIGGLEAADYCPASGTTTLEKGREIPVYSSLDQFGEDSAVVIDFTFPKVTLALIEDCKKKGYSIVIGSTGFTEEEIASIEESAKSISIVFGYNMSLGVNLLSKAVEMVASKLPLSYDCEITEIHHKFKKDSPSGTAIKLGKNVADGRKQKLDDVAIYGREGIDLDRPEGEIAMHGIRGGDVVGEHDVMFIGHGERIVLSHKAHSRMAFVSGAVEAASYLSDKPTGLFEMDDVLGF